MAVSDYTFEQMLDMIEFKKWANYKMPEHFYLNHPFYFTEFKEEIHAYADTELFVLGDIVSLALENAWKHGNKYDTSLPISLKIFEGAKGLVVRIRDSGKGFDFKKIQKKFDRQEEYFNNEGQGFKYYNKKEYSVSFENKGATINIMYLFNKNGFVETKLENLLFSREY